MDYRKIGGINMPISPVTLGTWAFGGGIWWGPQEDKDSVEVIDEAVRGGITMIDTAPVYGRGRSERVIGDFLRKHKLRERIVLATKLGLDWQGPKILHNLSQKRMLEEVDLSRSRLQTDYFDLYQVHWPDPDTPIAETAETMYKLKQKGITKAVGVSNYSLAQISEFMKYCPIDCLQPEYSMFKRDIETDIIPICEKNDIAIISYAPLYSGLLTGKFFLKETIIPEDRNRKLKSFHFAEPYFSINKEILEKLEGIASRYQKTLTQLVINWNFSQSGITSSIVGSRRPKQVKENLGSMGWKISDKDQEAIDEICKLRAEKIKAIKLEQNG
ncbi:MAG: aldo/keto reductase [Candidatus Omnitrophica bacterium]|nr:aldo/keto reductase [Candidatus Omnitrophota bacterium]MCF7877658.1 aldo/keto reductase [Candidatus Omnitrophota bacterium]MCF7878490.1 aldo/keto reductase [Candidatus Omnitrophota bacterium]